MSGMKNTIYKIRIFSAAFVFILSSIVLQTQVTHAADLVDRTISLGSSFASEVTTHSYDFTTATASVVGSIQFEYCSNSPLFMEPCVAPAGLDVTASSISAQSGITGFSVSGVSTPNSLVITRTPIAETPISASYVFDSITNPSAANSVVYTRITVFDNIDGTGAVVDTGAVAFVTEEPFDITAFVPPYMTFCVGVTVALDCSSTSGFLADFGEFSESTATTATSQFAVSTNDPTGYNTFITGQTMTSGANIIQSLSTQSFSNPGTPQFGLNLRANTNPSVGANPEAGPVANGSPAANYNIPNQFRFVDGDLIAGSNNSTGFNKYTASYIVNVPPDQQPGVYAATLTYTSIASF